MFCRIRLSAGHKRFRIKTFKQTELSPEDPFRFPATPVEFIGNIPDSLVSQAEQLLAVAVLIKNRPESIDIPVALNSLCYECKQSGKGKMIRYMIQVLSKNHPFTQ